MKLESAIDTGSEAWRAQCEARYFARLPDKEYRKHYLAGVRRKRGDAAAERLKADFRRVAGVP